MQVAFGIEGSVCLSALHVATKEPNLTVKDPIAAAFPRQSELEALRSKFEEQTQELTKAHRADLDRMAEAEEARFKHFEQRLETCRGEKAQLEEELRRRSIELETEQRGLTLCRSDLEEVRFAAAYASSASR